MGKKVWTVGTVAVIFLIALTALALSVNAQEDCDASIQVWFEPDCLSETRSAQGTLYVQNTGEQGTTDVDLEGSFTKGTGVIDPSTFSFVLGPGETVSATFSITVTEGTKINEAQIKWTVIDESCRPDHNVGKSFTDDFPWCPTAITLNSFTTTSVSSQPMSILLVGLTMTALVSSLLFLAFTIKIRLKST
jgi:hypothetical protein